jgi:hypothetical protein
LDAEIEKQIWYDRPSLPTQQRHVAEQQLEDVALTNVRRILSVLIFIKPFGSIVPQDFIVNCNVQECRAADCSTLMYRLYFQEAKTTSTSFCWKAKLLQ